jgi:hypothetical protein
VRRVAHEQPFPDEGFTLPEQPLAVLVHLRPEADLVERTIEADVTLASLDQDDVAIAWAADAFVAKGFARNLHHGAS